MKRLWILLGIGVLFLSTGALLICLGFTSEKKFFFFGIVGLAVGITSLLSYVSSTHIWICKECYLRFEAPKKSLLFLCLPYKASKGYRIYCPKCKKKTLCRDKKITARTHIY